MNKKQQQSNSSVRMILLAVFSLACALLLWVYVTDTVGEDIDRPFPGVKVEFVGESTMRETRELIISDVNVNSVYVTLSGGRRIVSSLDSADLTVTIDLNTINHTGNYDYAPQVSFPSGTDTSAITSAVVSPATISFYVDKLEKKTIDVVGVFNGSAAEGFVAEPLEFSPSTVIVYGPEQVLAEVKEARVEVNRTDVDRTMTFDSTYTLIDQEGKVFENDELTFDTDTVTVTLPVSAIKEVDLTIDLIPGGGVSEENISNNVKWKIEPDVITLTGDSEALAGVNNISVASIDLSLIEDSFTETYRISIPNNTEITGGVREATLTLEIGGLSKRTVTIDKSNITCINVSEGYAWEVMDSLSGVLLRGPEEELQSLSVRNNVRAVADLTDYGTATGFVQVPVRIEIYSVDGNSTVGAVGEYKVFVNITEAVNEEE